MTTIEKINSLFKKFNVNLEVAESSKEVAQVKMMAEGILDDGTKIGTSADTWSEGVDIFIVDVDGNQQPLPDGEYKLTDGTTLLVEGGILKMITPMEEVKVEEQAEEVENSAEATISTAQVEALMNLVAKLEVALSEEKKKNTLNETKVAELSKAPAVESVKNSKQTNNTNNKNVQLKSFKKMTYAERVSNILNK
ncbi:hypothetical protein UFOVP636_6 [uncultured Caudovirales phage]|uniref:Uncharacterized protein n=1 Tax=uncultured Caudovirales phage TaxID=2100421 RepID=A0A6J5N444_9CAUD|nr:hypothetical protein UFOVP636_6 [uncultured Caudovirales phage]